MTGDVATAGHEPAPPAEPVFELTSFEAELVAHAVVGKALDHLQDQAIDVSEGARWGPDRTVRAEVLEALVTGALGAVHHRGVRLRGGRIQGILDLSWSELAQPLSLVECYFDGALLAHSARLKALVLRGSRLGLLDLSEARIEGSLVLDEGFSATGEVRFLGVDVGGQLSFRGATLSNDDGHALNADRVRVNGNVYLDQGFSAGGEVGLLDADVGGDLSCRRATLRNDDGYAFNANGARVKGSVFLDERFSATGEVCLLGVDVGGELSCRGATLGNDDGFALNADGATVKGNFFLDQRFSATGEVRLVGVHVGGQLSFRGATLGNDDGFALNVDGATVKGNVYLDQGFSATGEVRLVGVDVGALAWDDEQVDGVLDLREATVRQLADRWVQPIKRGARLSGCRYESFVDGTDDSLGLRLAWVRSSPDYSPQPYTQLAAVYRRSGHDDRARKVFIAREVDRRRRTKALPLSKAKSLFLGATVAHGYQPARAVVVLIVLWLSGVLLLAGRPGENAMVATKAPTLVQPASSSVVNQPPTAASCPPRYPCFNPWVYSAETVIPLIKLGQTDHWQPSGHSTRYRVWFWGATALGWLFTTLAVAGVTGVIRKD